MCSSQQRVKARGFTLIEIIVTIVVLSIAGSALMSVFTSTIRTSADPMIQQQAIAIAEAYMEEILLKDFSDPDAKRQGSIVTETNSSEAGETRVNFDDVQDYNSLPDAVVRDQNNNVITQLSDYSVTVRVFGEALGIAPDKILAEDSMRIDITVSHPAISPIEITGYRTNY
ncbi:MAG: MSHA pilin protein MshD [Candidatus Azotimanducaceae bacterium]|jgi:MSHA pilin protein MshD